MVDHHSHGLHHGVARGRSHKAKAPFLEVLAHGLALGACAGRLGNTANGGIQNGFAMDKGPEKVGKTALLFLNFQHALGIVDDGLDLSAMAHNSFRRIISLLVDDAFDIAVCHSGHHGRVKIAKRAPVGPALAQYGPPRQSALGAFQRDLFKVRPIVARLFETPLGGHVRVVLGVAPGVEGVPRCFLLACDGGNS